MSGIPCRDIGGFLVPRSDAFFGVPKYLMHHRIMAARAIEIAMGVVANQRVAVDIGAHLGTWTCQLAEKFEHVVAFEPEPINFRILTANVGARENVRLLPLAVGPWPGRIALSNDDPRLSSTYYVNNANGSLAERWAPCMTLDSLKLPQVDLLKIDVEGLECEVIAGARETIERCKPVVIIEDNMLAGRYSHERGDAQKMLQQLGMSEAGKVEFMKDMFDVVMAWEVGA